MAKGIRKPKRPKVKTPEKRAELVIRSLRQGLSPEDRKHVHEGFRVLLKRIVVDQIKHAIADEYALNDYADALAEWEESRRR